MTTSIIIVGAGQIGSRHLQSLALINRPTTVYLVDPATEALQTSLQRFKAVAGSGMVKDVVPVADVRRIPRAIDLAIIATAADVRLKAIAALLDATRPRYLLLEKVLCQAVPDLVTMGNLISEHRIAAWVNCPRRMWAVYQELRAKLEGASAFAFSVSGSRWGLGSNGIHFLDLFAYLAGASELALFTGLLDPQSTQSKRRGYVEFSGTLCGTMNRNAVLAMTSHPHGDAPVVVNVSSDLAACIVDETHGRAWVSDARRGWSWDTFSFEKPLQSRLTHLAVEQILDRGHCELPTYEESARIHSKFLPALTDHLALSSGTERHECPIT